MAVVQECQAEACSVGLDCSGRKLALAAFLPVEMTMAPKGVVLPAGGARVILELQSYCVGLFLPRLPRRVPNWAVFAFGDKWCGLCRCPNPTRLIC